MKRVLIFAALITLGLAAGFKVGGGGAEYPTANETLSHGRVVVLTGR
jgi:hypothetical protein